MEGFVYRGRHISSFGSVYYMPNEKQRGEDSVQYELYDQELDGRDGGYFYGSRLKPRQFD